MVEVAAEGVSDAGVAQGAEGSVQLQGVVVERPQLLQLRQLHDVHAPGETQAEGVCMYMCVFVCVCIHTIFFLFNHLLMDT